MTSLAARQLGRTDYEISVVGAGSWAIGGAEWKYNWGAQDDATSVRALRHAAELGVNWIDTAAVYGRGHSEEVVGRAIASMPDAGRPYIFTKCGLRWSDADVYGDPVRCLRPDSIRQECQLSAAAGRRPYRSLPVPLAGRRRRGSRGLLGRDGSPD
jgi:aryl-alcohol dehydrogenase-like predicted oxidoreductase